MRDYEQFILDNYNEKFTLFNEIYYIVDNNEVICIKIGANLETLEETTVVILSNYKIINGVETYDSYSIYDINEGSIGFLGGVDKELYYDILIKKICN